MEDIKAKEVTLTIHTKGKESKITTQKGKNLKQVLIENGFSPHVLLTQKLNCGGNGLCATCGVWLEASIPATHWHDKLAKRFNYPRLSCQVTIQRDMLIALVDDKQIWGKPSKEKAKNL